METKDLMIDDHVSHFDEGKNCVVTELRGRKVAVSYIDDNGDTKYSELLPEMVFEPIPLTPETLKKNGFEKILDEDNIEYYRYYNRAADGYIKITLYDGGDGDWRLEIVNYDKFNDNEIRYKNESSFLKVHQLQHALRLCGINKEIEI